jgi:hypothetical protein
MKSRNPVILSENMLSYTLFALQVQLLLKVLDRLGNINIKYVD